MQEPGRRPFAGAVDLRRPKGYPAASAAQAQAEVGAAAEGEAHGDPCPRCESRDTKFCYYNNYNTSQPRHYCKSCRRYWTKGGTLRNVPVGGGSRKSSSSSSSSSSSPKRAKNSKRRRVAPAAPPEPEPGADASAAVAPDAATTKEAAATEDVTRADDPAVAPAADRCFTLTAGEPDAPPAADGCFAFKAGESDAPPAADGDGCLAFTAGEPDVPPAAEGDGALAFTDHPSVALGLGVADDAGGKELADPSPFEWPSGCDLGSYWVAGVFADTDPALFLSPP